MLYRHEHGRVIQPLASVAALSVGVPARDMGDVMHYIRLNSCLPLSSLPSKVYDKMTDLEKKEFFQNFIDYIEIYPDKKANERILKRIHFRFPVYYKGQSGDTMWLRTENGVETVCLLGRRKPDDTIKVSVNMDDYYQIRDAEEAEKNPL